jgi:flagellar assembly factor FliW
MKEARMLVSSTRFGEVEVRDEAILDFPDGLIGLPGTRYALLGNAPDSPFFWLHSVDHDVAVPVTNPWQFFDSYEVRVSDEDAARLQLSDPSAADILCVVRATEQLEDFSINLAAPVVLHTASKLGRQIINDAHGYAVREPLFGEVELGDVQAATSRVPVVAQAS